VKNKVDPSDDYDLSYALLKDGEDALNFALFKDGDVRNQERDLKRNLPITEHFGDTSTFEVSVFNRISFR